LPINSVGLIKSDSINNYSLARDVDERWDYNNFA
jgi:hypothetical protein